MKSFRDYLTETELMEEAPSIGDVFEIEIAREELVLETQVVGLVEDGIVIEADDTIMRILTHVGYLTEDSNMPAASDLIRSVHGRINREHSSNDDLEEQQAQDAFKDLESFRQRAKSGESGASTPRNKMLDVDKFENDKSFGRVPAGTSYSDWQKQQTKPTNDANLKEGANIIYYVTVEKPGTEVIEISALTPQDAQDQAERDGYKVLKVQDPAELDEAKYQGREVPLGKPMQGDVAKSKVYVRDPKTGNVKKVNFGDPDMKIKKSNPARRKSFRARHNCANPGPRTKARYWSCRAW